MNKLLPVPKALLAGALANLITGLVIWVFTIVDLFVVLGVPIAAPNDALPWLLTRMMWGGLAGLVFLVPYMASARQWKRGALAAIVPIGSLLLVIYPRGHEGWLGLELGYALPVTAIIVWLAWGVVAGWLLDRWGMLGGFSAPLGMDE